MAKRGHWHKHGRPGEENKPPPKPGATMPVASGSPLPDNSILSRIQQHLASNGPAQSEDIDTEETSSKIPPQNRQHPASSIADTSVTSVLSSSTVPSQSHEARGTRETKSLAGGGLCKIVDLRTGLCLRGKGCRLVHVLDDDSECNETAAWKSRSIEIRANSAMETREGSNVRRFPLLYPRTYRTGPQNDSDSIHGLSDKSPPVVKDRAANSSAHRGDCQKSRCHGNKCNCLHLPVPPDSRRPAPSGVPLDCTRDLQVAGQSTDVGGRPQKRLGGICWAWRKGRCRNDGCRYRHTKPQDTIAKPIPNVSSVARDAAVTTMVTNGAQSGDDQTKIGRNPLSAKDGCSFCRLGLCEGTHRTADSFIFTGSRLPQPTAVNNVYSSKPDASVTRNNSQNPVGVAHVPPKSAKPPMTERSSGTEELTLPMLKATRVTIGRGLQILDVSTAFESKLVSLGNLPATVSESEIRKIGMTFGELSSVEIHPKDSRCLARLVYTDQSQAASAASSLNGSKLFSEKITARLYYSDRDLHTGRLSACLVRVDIPTPGITVYAGYEALQEAERITKTMHGSTCKNHLVSAQVHDGVPKVGPFTVKFEGLPYQTLEKHVHDFGQGKGKPVPGDILLTKCLYKSSPVDVANVLKKIFSEYGTVISLDFTRHPPSNGRLCGIARFSDRSGAAAACLALNGRKFAFLGHERIYLQHLHRMNYKIPSPVYGVLRSELHRLSSFARGQPGVQLSFNDTASGVTDIELNASHLDSLKRVKVPLEHLISGETLMEQGKPVWANFFSTSSGIAFITSVARKTRTYVRSHAMRCIIQIWGSNACRTGARRLLLEELARLRTTRSFALPLAGNILMKLLFNSLDDIRKELGEDNASVNFTTHQLIIRGTDEHFRWAVHYLNEHSGSTPPNKLSSRKTKVAAKHGTCPVCMDSVTDDVSLDCGHAVCKDCLIRYMVSAGDNKVFPLKCLGDENHCAELLPLSLCRQLLRNEQFIQLAEASFFTYIQTRPQEFHYCPTPDCPQIYRDTPEASLQCPICLVSICTSCHKVEHDGFDCAVSNEACERLFDDWREQHNVKKCPNCSANIEKIAGCNHMTCASCSAHICWECLETFKVSNEVYDHMNRAHGGIGL